VREHGRRQVLEDFSRDLLEVDRLSHAWR
jgi:hypothetical protein